MNYLVMPSQAAKRPRARICVVHLPTLAQLVVQDLVVLRQPELALGAAVAAMRMRTARRRPGVAGAAFCVVRAERRRPLD